MSSAGVDTEGIQGTEARVATSNDRALVWKYFPSAREGSLLERYVVKGGPERISIETPKRDHGYEFFHDLPYINVVDESHEGRMNDAARSRRTLYQATIIMKFVDYEAGVSGFEWRAKEE